MSQRLWSPNEQFCDANGVPFAGGSLAFYASGTSTPQNTYSDSALSVANTNPLVLDSAGRAGSVFLSNLAYKVVLADKNSVVIWTMDPVQVPAGSGIYVGGTSTGSANAQVLASVTPTGYARAAGNIVIFIPGFTNNSAATLNVAGTGNVNVFKNGPSGATALTGSELVATQIAMVIDDGTEYVLQNTAGSGSVFGTQKTIGAAATTDLGSVGGQNVKVTGAAIISSFGNSASITQPIYIVEFSGANSLTNSATLQCKGGVGRATAAGETAVWLFTGSSTWVELLVNLGGVPPLPYPTNYVGGLTLSNDATLPNTTIDIATGVAASDDATMMLILSTAFNKTTGSWALGPSSGALDTGAVANGTWYHVFLIGRSDTGVVDVLFSTNATAPTMPASYTKKRRIGSFKTDGSAHILPFTQFGAGDIREYTWTTTTTDITNDTTLSTSVKFYTVNTPLGIKTLARVSFKAANSGSGAAYFIFSPDTTTIGGIPDLQTNASTIIVNGQFLIRTSTSSQVATQSSVATNNTVSLGTSGWIDFL